MARFIAEGDVLDLVVSGSAVASGDIVQVAGKAGIVVCDGAIGETVGVQIRGLVAVPCASVTTISAGAVVEHESSDGTAVASGGDFVMGIAAYAKTNGQTEVYVLLNGQDKDTVA